MPGTIFCPHCGTQNEDDDLFCVSCGKKLSVPDIDASEIPVNPISSDSTVAPGTPVAPIVNTIEPEHSTPNKKAKSNTFFQIAIVLSLVVVAIFLYDRLIVPNRKTNTTNDFVAVSGEGTVIWSADEETGNWSTTPTLSIKRHVPGVPCIAHGGSFTVGLKSNGALIATGNNDDGQCNVSHWRDIVYIVAGTNYTVGLKADGTVVATGDNSDGQCDVGTWRDIVDVDAAHSNTVALKADGTVIAIGDNSFGQCDVDDWHDIVDIGVGGGHIVGLKADGTVVVTGVNSSGQCDVDDWHDIVGIAVGNSFTVGLKADGTVVVAGDNYYGQCDVGTWRDIVDIKCPNDGNFVVGFKKDGTIIAVGDNREGQLDFCNWQDIAAVFTDALSCICMKADGSVVYAGSFWYYSEEISSWNLLK